MASSAGNDEIGALHKALRSRDVETVRFLGPSCLLWQENSIGWTALHVAASHGWTEEEWLLNKAIEETASSAVALKEATSSEISPLISSLTHTGGQSCVALFFRRHVDPLPWHHAEVKDAAAILRDDLSLVAGTPSLVDECRTRLKILLDPNTDREQQENGDDAAEFSHGEVLSVMNDLMLRVVRFWQRMELWLRAAYLGTLSTDEQSWSLLHALAFVGGCPREVAQLAIALYPDQACCADTAGNLPLHLLCSSHNNDSDCEFLLQALLEVHPGSAKCANQEGRLPLNVALAHGKHGTIIQRLVTAEPLVLYGMRDLVTGLPSFALAATREISITEVWAQRHKTSDVGSLWHFLPPPAQEEGLQRARCDLEIVKLNTIYRTLRAMPSAVQFGIK